MERQVLVLFPHPDDETLAVGGAIAVHAHSGSPVTYACFTKGQMGRNLGKPFFANRETLSEIRELELRAACEQLGIRDLRLFPFRDKTLEFEDPEHLADIILGLLLELDPSLVITYYPEYCVHPDHEAIAEATIRAFKRLPPAKRPQLWGQAFAHGHEEALGPRDIVIDTSAVWQQVYGAIKAHKSQTAGWVTEMESGLNGTPEDRAAVVKRLSTASLYTIPID